MAGTALHHAVCPKQGKPGLRVVKAVHIGPGPHVVTSLTAEHRPIRTALGHPVVELAVVRIVMAPHAGHVREPERQYLVLPPRSSHFVTLGACHRSVRTVQRVFSVAMLQDAEGGAVEIKHRVALFAAVLVRSSGKLVIVSILVTVRAGRELHLVNGVLASRQVTLAALHRDVLSP